MAVSSLQFEKFEQHPKAAVARFPEMERAASGLFYALLNAQDNEEVFAIDGNNHIAIFSRPLIDGHWFVTVIYNGIATGLTRPIVEDFAILVAQQYEFDPFTMSSVSMRPSSRSKRNSWVYSTDDRQSTHCTHDTGTVYFVQADIGGPVKIGVAQSLKSRIAYLQRHSPFPLVVLATLPGGYRTETEIHRRFKRIRLHGEWFSPSRALMRFIRNIPIENAHLAISILSQIPKDDPSREQGFKIVADWMAQHR